MKEKQTSRGNHKRKTSKQVGGIVIEKHARK